VRAHPLLIIKAFLFLLASVKVMETIIVLNPSAKGIIPMKYIAGFSPSSSFTLNFGS